MLSKIPQFVKDNLNNILVIALVTLFILLSFGAGYIMAKYQDRVPITITN